MNKQLKHNYLLIVNFFIVFSAVIDAFTFFTRDLFFSFGMVFRGALLFISLLNIFLNYKSKHNLLIIVLLFLFSSIFIIIHQDFESVMYIFKLMFLVILPLAIINHCKTYSDAVSVKHYNLCLLLYNLIILIAFVTNSSSATYGLSKVGDIGWFNSPNEIGAIISIICAYLYVSLLKRRDYFSVVNLILSVIVSFIIGTKLPLVVMMLIFLHFLYFGILSKIYGKKRKITILLLFVFSLILFCFLVLPKLPIYKNIRVHLDYLNISNNPLRIFTSAKLFDHFIFNQRLTFLKNIHEIFLNSSITYKLLGLKNIIKTVEIDIFDIFYRFGIIGFVLFITYFVYFIKLLSKNRFNKFLNLILLLPIFLSGHALLNPNVLLILSTIFIFNSYKNNLN